MIMHKKDHAARMQREGDHSSFAQLWPVILTVAPTLGVDEDDFQDGWEPIWFQMLLDEGFELQRAGYSTDEVVRNIRRLIRNKRDARV